MKLLLVALLAAAIPTAAAAQSMNAEEFHKRATALQKKGPLALFSRGEINILMKEGQAAGAKAREQRQTAVAAGRKARYCPPEGPQQMSSTEFMKHLSAIPVAERKRIDMTEATTRVLARKFPCPA